MSLYGTLFYALYVVDGYIYSRRIISQVFSKIFLVFLIVVQFSNMHGLQHTQDFDSKFFV